MCISSGLVEVTHEYASRKHDKLVAYCNECEALLRENNIELPLRKKKIDKLKRLDAPLESQASSDSLGESSIMELGTALNDKSSALK